MHLLCTAVAIWHMLGHHGTCRNYINCLDTTRVGSKCHLINEWHLKCMNTAGATGHHKSHMGEGNIGGTTGSNIYKIVYIVWRLLGPSVIMGLIKCSCGQEQLSIKSYEVTQVIIDKHWCVHNIW